MSNTSKSRGTRGHGRPVKKPPAVTQTSVPVQPSRPTPVNSSPPPGSSASGSSPRPSRPSTMPAVKTGLHMPGKIAIGVVTGAMVAGGAYYMYKRHKAQS